MPKKVAHLPKHVLVVDDDEVILRLIGNHLRGQGIKHVDTFSTGTQAWQAISSAVTPYDLLIIDWRLKDRVSGLAIFNRLRTKPRYQSVPVLVISGTLDPEDFRLLEELPCTRFLAKPFSQAILSEELLQLGKEYFWHTQNKVKLDEALVSVNDQNIEQTLLSISKIVSKAPNQTAIAILASQFLREKGYLGAALETLSSALQREKKSIRCLTEYGRILLLLGRHREALQVLKAASSYSPKNLERLCLTGTAQVNLCDPTAARKAFRAALELDPECEQALSGLAVSDSLEKMINSRNSAYEGSNSPISYNFVSLINTTAIAMVRNAEFDKGVSLYRQALMFVTVNNLAAKLAFNIGLAYWKNEKPAEAYPWFVQADELSSEPFLKAKKYISIMRDRLDNGLNQITEMIDDENEEEIT